MTQDSIDLRGSDKCCPKCSSTDVKANTTVKWRGYGPGLAVCRSCSCVWEYWTEGQVWDLTDAVCSFSEPCNNCAFRKGSPERGDPVKWAGIRDLLKEDSPFFCHKGVPIEAGAEHGFAYPRRETTVTVDGMSTVTQVYDTSKLRMCRGWLNAWAGEQRKEAETPSQVPALSNEANHNG